MRQFRSKYCGASGPDGHFPDFTMEPETTMEAILILTSILLTNDIGRYGLDLEILCLRWPS
jgi:hypothetical protein